MSTDLITYLNYISTLKSAKDEDITNFFHERQWFIELGKSDMIDKKDSEIDGVFDKIDKLARQLEEEEIAQESVKLGEDVAAVTALWTFGLSMAAFATLKATDTALGAAIKIKENQLYNALSSADKDIADGMGGPVPKYVDAFNTINTFMEDKNPKGLTPQAARNYLYNFMDYISMHGGVTVDNFKKYIQIAEDTQNDEKISNVYDILDTFTLSSQGPDEMKDALSDINRSGLDLHYLEMIRNFTLKVWKTKMKISSDELNQLAKEAGVPPEECEVSVLENMDCLGKIVAGLTVVISIVDAFLNVYNIVETVKRYRENIKTFNEARENYKEYYQELYDASVKYAPKS